MVVSHHYLDSSFFSALNLLHSRNAVIYSDDQLDSRGNDHFHRLHGKTIALIQPFRDVIAHISAFALQVLIQQHRGGDPIAVIVAKDKNFLSLVYRPAHNRHCFFHIMQFHGVAQRLGTVQKGFC